ncbi:hypothetical protein [Rhizobacter sp. Root1221]|uniref:hypothetical protein n=1 Tax=Rhizobacter sp. Root1221 TaxID=1736433 RepID=UPI000A44A8E0|nr:hypothetical protein [Rhizobacter sp. Root1221]
MVLLVGPEEGEQRQHALEPGLARVAWIVTCGWRSTANQDRFAVARYSSDARQP